MKLRIQALCAATWLMLASAGCGDHSPCNVPGVVETCACGNGTKGARACAEDREWRDCDCSGAIALANRSWINPTQRQRRRARER